MSETVQDKRQVSINQFTNRKSYMSFQLVPKSVTLNDLEQRNGPLFCVFSPNTAAFLAHYVKVVEDIPEL